MICRIFQEKDEKVTLFPSEAGRVMRINEQLILHTICLDLLEENSLHRNNFVARQQICKSYH